VLLLSIHPMHVERIFAGTKRYELRRRLPRQPFSTVYLYQTGKTGIVGGFDVSAIHEASKGKLWKTVGAAATPKERFDAYFLNTERGYAIEIRDPFRFAEPVTLQDLRRQFKGFAPPLGYVLLDAQHPLAVFLQERRRGTPSHPPRVVSLRKIRPAEHKAYEELVTAEISRNYDEIDARFAEFNLRVHAAGVDPFGFLTESKEVLVICDDQRRTIGFTTLTSKRGGAVKSGPTILFRPYRQMGYGAATRQAIEARVRSKGMRKLYCTAPEIAPDVVQYLLASGMRIEAHLERHYTDRHNELVLGKVLTASRPRREHDVTRTQGRGKVVDPTGLPHRELVQQIEAMFTATWFSPRSNFMVRVIESALEDKPGHPKPRTLVCAAAGRECIAAVLLVSKRGGAAKVLLLRATDDRQTVMRLIRQAEQRGRELERRKLFFLHPIEDARGVWLLRQAGYVPEGLLREPYTPGQDVIVLSKFLEPN
jgi:predicted transcriptional regulator